jgi:ketosteroid isomerase-like protein
MRFARLLFVALALAVCAGTAGAAPTPAPPNPVLTGIAAAMAADQIENDAKELRMRCAPSATIIDEYPPYSWSGADACPRWAAAFKAFAAQIKLTNPKVTVKPNPFVDVSGNRAYVTAQVRVDAVVAGKPLSDEGTWAFVLTKSGGTWKVTSMAWGVLHH